MTAPPAAGTRRLVINADDFGLSEGVNRGIVEAHLAGTVTSTSLLVNLPAFADALRCRLRAPKLGVGLHFNLTAGPPVAPPERVPSLCDRATGQFVSLRRLIARTLAGRVVPAEVTLECEAQLARLRAAGVRVTHIDSHRHVHLLPGIWKAVRDTAERAGIPVVRVPFDAEAWIGRRPSAFAEQLSLRAAYRIAGGKGLRAPVDHFRGTSLFAVPNFREHLLALLDQIPAGVTELMVHPGYADDEILRWDTYTAPRERELAALTDARVRSRLAAGDFTLTTFEAVATAPPPAPVPVRTAPRFSVVVPAYNESRYLPRLLDSLEVARRLYGGGAGAVEVIVVDNGSTDGTREIARARGCTALLEPKRVIGAVRNTGARVARGDTLVFIDADSQVHPETFLRLEAALESPAVLGGATGITMDRWSPGIAVTWFLLDLWCRLTGWDTGVLFCRREIFEAVGGFDERLLFAEDLALYKELRRVARERGQRFVRLAGIRAVNSARKFEQFGQWGWPLANTKIIWLALVRSPRARRLIERAWYEVKR
ncbi:MAG TPA: ChbG/HpnK family deacetylase [Gemmatimonadales bacterium]